MIMIIIARAENEPGRPGSETRRIIYSRVAALYVVTIWYKYRPGRQTKPLSLLIIALFLNSL